jgi:hypothetical protein
MDRSRRSSSLASLGMTIPLDMTIPLGMTGLLNLAMA